jgi:hypothetical protein
VFEDLLTNVDALFQLECMHIELVLQLLDLGLALVSDRLRTRYCQIELIELLLYFILSLMFLEKCEDLVVLHQ